MRLIDADALETALNFAQQWSNDTYNHGVNKGLNDAIFLVKSSATIDPVTHGHWIPKDLERSFGIIRGFECSVCGEETVKTYKLERYCRACGALMDEVINRDS